MHKWPEHEWIVENYPLMGPKWIAAKIGRHYPTVRMYANKHGLVYGLSATIIIVNKLAMMAGVAPMTVTRAAEAAGVLTRRKKAHNNQVITYVPTKWADEYLERLSRPSTHELTAERWRDLGQAARELGLSRHRLGVIVKTRRGWLWEVMRGNVRVVEATSHRGHRTWMFDPAGLALVANKVRRMRAKAKTMVSCSQLTVDLAAHLTTDRSVSKHMRKQPSYELLPRGYKLMGHISHEDAGKLLARYGVSYEDPGSTRPGDPAPASRNLEDARPGLHRAVGPGGAGSTRDVRAEQRLLHSPAGATELQEGSR